MKVWYFYSPDNIKEITDDFKEFLLNYEIPFEKFETIKKTALKNGFTALPERKKIIVYSTDEKTKEDVKNFMKAWRKNKC